MTTRTENSEFLTVPQAAREKGIGATSLRAWIYAGHLKTTRTGRQGWHRIRRSDLDAFLSRPELPRCSS
ncbi:helix-turn-helix domain-containing protein [Dietzia sp. PP-33]|jgi:excisionase family DNA binding protein|uniref:helix-turn-helix domain-containing protein n=1 Tax=Dietzia sp. PP-33 TaxID=2957500 RepID=UPI0029B847C0|nr:helix-turn-helix domain-containing protein [Dietzia sp. PP-33]MDX2356147.1 helix-turn-helix domain-containing protein [Dietzia sp. PP-33]